MTPGSYNLILYRGDTGRWKFQFWTDASKTTPADLTGATATATIRDAAVGGSMVATLACTVTVPNTVDMLLTPEQSRALPAKGVWDLQLTYASGDIVTPLAGSVSVSQDVTYTASARAAGVRVV